MFLNPKYIQFNRLDDVVDYVSFGLVPTEKNVEAVLTQLKNYDEDENIVRGIDTPLSFNPYIYNESDPKTAAKVLERVYENRKKNQVLASIGIICAIPVLFMLKK